MRSFVSMFVYFFAGAFVCGAQPATLQTLIQKLNATGQDTSRVMAYRNIARWYQNKNPDSAVLIADSALQLARKIDFKKGVVYALLTKGVSLDIKGKYPEALSYYFEALRLSEAQHFEDLTGNTYNVIGIVYMNMADYPKAIDYFKKSLSIIKKINGDASSLMVNIGEVYKKNSQPDSSIVYNKEALEIAIHENDSLSMAITLANIGDNYIASRLYHQSLPYLKQALSISESINDYEGIAYANNSLGLAYYQLNLYNESIGYALKSAQTGQELHIYRITRDAYHLLYLNQDTLAQYQQALYYRNLEISLNDSLSTVAKNKQIEQLQATYDLEKKQQQVDLLNKQQAAQQREINRNEWIGMLGTALFVLLALFTFHLYKNNSVKKKFNKQLEQQNKEIIHKNLQLEEVNSMKNKLFSIVGHDLRGPIGSLSGMLELLNSDALSKEETHYFLTQINSSLASTRHLLNNLLYWAKSQMEGMHMNVQAFDVAKVIGQNIQLVKTRTAEKGIALEAGTDGAPAVAFADEMTTDLVIRNLIENAVKFCSAGDTVTVLSNAENGFVKILVKDTGPGIPPENQAKIFNKAVTHTTFGSGHEKGSGLGLLLCKELVEKNGGVIGFVSALGEGSTFYFTIPAASVAQKEKEGKVFSEVS